MTVEMLRSMLGWCTILNWGILLVWWATIALARDWLHGVHRTWFDIPPRRIDEMHDQLMGLFKIGIFLFNLSPYLALRIVGG